MPAKLDRCVRHLKAKGKVRSPHAVCKKALKLSKASRKKKA